MTRNGSQRRRLRRLALGLLLVLAPDPGRAANGDAEAVHDEVLIVVNRESPISRAIGDYYRKARNVPVENVVELSIPLQDPNLGDPKDQIISRRRFGKLIRDPIAQFLESKPWAGRIEIIVTTQGLPLRVLGPSVPVDRLLRERSDAAVDAELALLGSGRDGSPGVAESRNPYLGSELPFGEWRRRNPQAPLRYLVARLAGYPTPLDPETGVPVDVKRAIDAAQAPTRSGVFLVDEDPAVARGRKAANGQLLAPAAALLAARGLAVRHERTPAFASGVERILGLASWGSNATRHAGAPFWGEVRGRRYPGSFAPRAVAVPLVSTNARSFVQPPQYGQSLVADLVRLGVAGCAGHVYEPTLTGVPRAHLLLYFYAEGVPAAEAYFRSLPFLGWMNVWIGDPLMRSGALGADARGRKPDRDGDGHPDAADNCLWIPNPSQRDDDGDGSGNRCDADVNGDGLVTTSWGAIQPPERSGDLEIIALAIRAKAYLAALDLDEDGDVDEDDLRIASLGLFQPPGPPGRSGPSGSSGPPRSPPAGAR